MTEESKKIVGYMRFFGAMICLILAFYYGMRNLGTTDFTYVFSWWMTLIVLGILMQPLAITLFSRFHDGGWVFSKALGIVVCGYVVWLLSSVKLVKFTRTACFIVSFLVLAAGAVLFYYLKMKKDRKYRISEFYNNDRLISIFCSEAIFFCVFVFWCYLKGKNPAAYGTERFMDYNYMLSIFKGEYMPPKDVWLSGEGINYYYLGQYYAAFITKLASVPVTHGYNIAMMMLPAFGFSMPYSLAVNLLKTRFTDRKDELVSEKAKSKEYRAEIRRTESWLMPSLGGFLAAIGVSASSSMHYPVYRYLVPKLDKLLNRVPKKTGYWFPDATRYIGEYYERDDKTIHEFPVYSYVIGDLHAHVINTIFVMTLLAVLLAFMLRRKAISDRIRDIGQADAPDSILKEVLNPMVLTAAFLIGIFYMTNTWDFAIYFVVSGAIILFSNLVVYGFKKRALIVTIWHALVFVVMSFLVSLPFRIAFKKISKGIGITSRHSLFRELLVLWGLPVACMIALAVVLVVECVRAQKASRKKEKKPFIRALFDSMTIPDMFVLTIMLCAGGLVLIPEVVFARDIYGGAYERANTMFKLAYQAFILFEIGMAYVIFRFLVIKRSIAQKFFAGTALVLMLLCAGYFKNATDAWFTGDYTTLDASAFLKTTNQADAEMVEYINNYIKGQPVIAEMGGLSYTYFNRISTFTGNPTVIGWQTHEWLWRCNGSGDCPQEVIDRKEDIKKLYSSQDADEVRAIIDKYDIEYIYYGECELVYGYEQYSADDDNLDHSNLRLVSGSYYAKLESNLEVLLSLGDIEKLIPASGSRNYTTYLIRVRR